MAKQLNNPNVFSSDFEHNVVRFPTRWGALAAGSSRRPAADTPVGVKRHVIRQVVVLEVTCPLRDVTQQLDHEIQLALSDEPRGVVCDLSGRAGGETGAVVSGDQTPAIDALAGAGRHVRDWPGIPVAVACPERQVQEALHSHPLGGHLTTAGSELTAVLSVLSNPAVAVRRLRLDPHASAPRDSRDFVAFVLQDWGLERLVLSAGHVVSELVIRSTIRAFSTMDLSVSWNQDALRLCVRNGGPGLKARRPPPVEFRRQGQSAIAGISRAHGILPTAEGGKARWAVLNAALPGPMAALVALEGADAEKDLPESW
jgi:hypothetical protein